MEALLVEGMVESTTGVELDTESVTRAVADEVRPSMRRRRKARSVRTQRRLRDFVLTASMLQVARESENK